MFVGQTPTPAESGLLQRQYYGFGRWAPFFLPTACIHRSLFRTAITVNRMIPHVLTPRPVRPKQQRRSHSHTIFRRIEHADQLVDNANEEALCRKRPPWLLPTAATPLETRTPRVEYLCVAISRTSATLIINLPGNTRTTIHRSPISLRR